MATSLETIVSWAKRKGFVYPNSEIYWGLANAWDFWPYGALLKKNISDLWIKHFTQQRDDVVFMDTAIIAHPTTWKASGHLDSFSDALIDDKNTGQRFRADKIIEEHIEEEVRKRLQKKWFQLSYKILDEARLIILEHKKLEDTSSSIIITEERLQEAENFFLKKWLHERVNTI